MYYNGGIFDNIMRVMCVLTFELSFVQQTMCNNCVFEVSPNNTSGPFWLSLKVMAAQKYADACSSITSLQQCLHACEYALLFEICNYDDVGMGVEACVFVCKLALRPRSQNIVTRKKEVSDRDGIKRKETRKGWTMSHCT